MAGADELKKLLLACDAENAPADVLVAALKTERSLTKVNDFYKYFKHHSLRDWWNESDSRKTQGPLLVVLDTVWEAAQDIANAANK